MTVRVAVQPALLTWACHRRGVTPNDLARGFPKLEQWTRGQLQPTLKQLEAFAAATYTPLGYFFLARPPIEEVPIPDMRTIRGAAIVEPSPDLLETVYICQRRQEWYRDFARSTGASPLPFVGSLRLGVDPVTAARRMRADLQFDPAAHRASKDWTEALRALVEHADRAGVLVMFNGVVGVNTHRKLDPEEFRGFALSDPLAPLVFINGADSKSAQMFTLAHELAHLWCGASALSDVLASRDPGPALERWCNAVAAELLVPLMELRAELRVNAAPAEEARRLAGVFKVSTLVMLRRLHDAGRLARDEMWALYQIEVARLQRRAGSAGGGNFYLTQKTRVGRRLAAAVLVSTWEGRSSFTEAFRLLDVSSADKLQKLGVAVGVVV